MDARPVEGLDPSVGGTLAEEAARYLAVVDIFRREGCEPRWRAESEPENAVALAAPGAANVSRPPA